MFLYSDYGHRQIAASFICQAVETLHHGASEPNVCQIPFQSCIPEKAKGKLRGLYEGRRLDLGPRSLNFDLRMRGWLQLGLMVDNKLLFAILVSSRTYGEEKTMSESDNKNRQVKIKRSEIPVYVPPKLTKDEIIEFAAYAIEIPDVTRILKNQHDGVYIKQEDIEDSQEILNQIRNKYLKKKGLNHKLGLAYGWAYILINMQLLGEIDSVTSEQAREKLISNVIVEYLDDDDS